MAHVVKSGRIPRLALTHFHLNVMLNICKNQENAKTAFPTLSPVIWGNRCMYIKSWCMYIKSWCMYIKSSCPFSTFSFTSKSWQQCWWWWSPVTIANHEIWKNPQAHANTLSPQCYFECICEIWKMSKQLFLLSLSRFYWTIILKTVEIEQPC